MPLTRREILRGAGASVVLGSTGCFLWPDSGDGKDLSSRQTQPFNGEPRLDRLVESWITPNQYFFVRTHGTIPDIDLGTYALTVSGQVDRSLRFPLEELEKLPRVSVTATLQCAENRRTGQARLKTEGIPWEAGAVGTAEWRGVRLADVLSKAGVAAGARYAWFDGLDAVTLKDRQTVFGGQVPLERAMRAEAIIALEMNGRPLTADHGYPARVILPGCIGARSVKWLGRIVVSEVPSPNYFVSRGYKILPPDADPEKVKTDDVEPLLEAPLSSAIGRPLPAQTVPPGRLVVAGYAVPPGTPGVTVASVEVSPDGGARWVPAMFTGPEAPFAWRLWMAEVEVASGSRTLVVRATDSKGRRQPERPAPNLDGLMFDGWHRVPITVA
jgi:sulfite oxidase